jgi:hypothetical protein
MPSRSSRNHARKSAPIRRTDDDNDARHTPQQRASPPITFTPPTQLPTPLPEEHIPISQRPAGAAPPAGLLNFADAADDSNGNAHLIDFDTPTPPPALLSFTHPDLSYTQPGGAMVASTVLSSNEDDGPGSSTVYRSPPYREARLPDDSPPPLPVPARYQHEHTLNDDNEDDGGMQGGGFAGGTRAPTFVGCVSHFVRTSFFWGSFYVRLGLFLDTVPCLSGLHPQRTLLSAE